MLRLFSRAHVSTLLICMSCTRNCKYYSDQWRSYQVLLDSLLYLWDTVKLRRDLFQFRKYCRFPKLEGAFRQRAKSILYGVRSFLISTVPVTAVISSLPSPLVPVLVDFVEAEDKSHALLLLNDCTYRCTAET